MSMLPNRRQLLATTFAQRAAIDGPVPPHTVWLNANESPEGPPEASRLAISAAIAEAGRYNHRALGSIQDTVAAHFGLSSQNILLGNGSSEALHCALEAFTSASRPLVTAWPTWEMMAQIAEKSGRQVIRVPLTSRWTADAEALLAQAKKHPRGCLLHLGNPNNPTSSLTPLPDLAWLVENLPANSHLVVDEAYMDYVEPKHNGSALPYVAQQRNVIVTRTFSKLYGLAGARIGLACARAELISAMLPFRENVVGILGARAAEAALRLGEPFVQSRRSERLAVRGAFCGWLTKQGLEFVPPAANFVLIRIPLPVADVIPRLLARGVAIGRRFDTLDRWMRVAIGLEPEMAKLMEHLPQVLAAKA